MRHFACGVTTDTSAGNSTVASAMAGRAAKLGVGTGVFNRRELAHLVPALLLNVTAFWGPTGRGASERKRPIDQGFQVYWQIR
ncbi:hypothetical protein BU198_36265 [Streptomyces sp. CBMA156]|nr:hypothetical protein [Streptomyces sp. CBMA156]